MRLNHLEEIIKSIHSELTCPHCRTQFAAESFDVVDLIGDRGIFAAHCQRCNTSTMIVTSVREHRQRIVRRASQAQKVSTSKVSPVDVVEMKNFLDHFSGDLGRELDQKIKPNTKSTDSEKQA